MSELKRVWVYKDTYDKIRKFAKDRFIMHDERGENNKPLQDNFPKALERFIEVKDA